MLKDASLIAFTATTHAQRALDFYRDQLGLTLVEQSEFALVFRAGATMLRVQIVHKLEPHAFTALGWDVRDIRATIADLAKRGIAVEHYTFVELDADGIWWTPNGDGVAWFKDPDGNILSLTQFA